MTRSTGRPNAVDGSLVELRNEGVVHIVILIVGVKDDLAVTREARSNGLPVRPKTARVGDHISVIAPEVL